MKKILTHEKAGRGEYEKTGKRTWKNENKSLKNGGKSKKRKKLWKTKKKILKTEFGNVLLAIGFSEMSVTFVHFSKKYIRVMSIRENTFEVTNVNRLILF